MRIVAQQPDWEEHATGGSADGLQALSQAAETLDAMDALDRQYSAPPLPLTAFGGSASGSGGSASGSGGRSSGRFSSSHNGSSSTSSDSWEGAGGYARMSAPSEYSGATAADNATSPRSSGGVPDATQGPRPNAFATPLPPKPAGRFRRWLGRASGSTESAAALRCFLVHLKI